MNNFNPDRPVKFFVARFGFFINKEEYIDLITVFSTTNFETVIKLNWKNFLFIVFLQKFKIIILLHSSQFRKSAIGL